MTKFRRNIHVHCKIQNKTIPKTTTDSDFVCASNAQFTLLHYLHATGYTNVDKA